jgi:hypothetical protein
MNNPKHAKLVRDLEAQVERAQYRRIYMRDAPEINTIIVVAPQCSPAEVAARLLEGKPLAQCRRAEGDSRPSVE